MPFPTDSLIVAVVAGMSGGFGGAFLETRNEQRRARQARTDAHTDKQCDAYAAVVVAARLYLRNARQRTILYSRPGDLPYEPTTQNVLVATDTLSTDLNQAAVVVQLIGSPAAREYVQAVEDAARHSAELFQERSHRPASTRNRREFSREISAIFDSAEASSDLRSWRTP